MSERIRWTAEQEAYVRKFWTGPNAKTTKQIGLDLGINQIRVADKARTLGLKRDPLFVSEARSVARHGANFVRGGRRLQAESIEDKPLLAGPWPQDAPRFTDHPDAPDPSPTPRRLYGDAIHGMRCSPIATAAAEGA